MIRRIGHAASRFFRATTPDPIVLAVGLTFVVFLMAAIVTGTGPTEIVTAWQWELLKSDPAAPDRGFFSLLGFSMQMVLILVTGHALASTRPVRFLIGRVATLPKTGAQAAYVVSLVAMSTALLNWGLGLIVGAILARDVGRAIAVRGGRAHYPLLAAAGYTGLLCWHGGLSGTAPLMMTAPGNVAKFLGAELAAEVGTLPFTRTVFSIDNLVVTGGLLILVPLLSALLAPRGDEPVDSITNYLGEPAEAPTRSPTDSHSPAIRDRASTRREPFAARLIESRTLAWLIALPMLYALALWYRDRGLAELDPNALNLAMLALGLLLHGTLGAYVNAIGDATRGAAGIVLQFPFYAGIMGVMRVTGLGSHLAAGFAALASTKTYTTLTFLSAGLINFFVPSGGGQWAVQGPIAVEAAGRLGVPLEQAVMAVAYGDQLTNMLQPFWALPLLAITGVRARDMIGYTAVIMLAAGIWIVLCLITQSP